MSRRSKRELDPGKLDFPGMKAKFYVRGDMIGGGKVDLLRVLARTGSITGAAAEMGMSYRRAHFLLETMQRCFAQPIYVTTRGGRGAGGTVVTSLGLELIDEYDAAMEKFHDASRDFMRWLEVHQPEDGDASERAED